MKHLWTYIKPFLSPKFIISYAIPYMVVNGWAWVGFYWGIAFGENLFTQIATVWLGILWLPFTEEKLITIPAAIWIHTRLFKNDPKTRKQLDEMYQQAKIDANTIKMRFAITYGKYKIIRSRKK